MKKNYNFITNKEIEKSVVSQSNKLTMSRQVLSLVCRKLIYLIIYKIRQKNIKELELDNDNQYILKIPFKDLKYYNVLSKSNDLINVLLELRKYANNELTINYTEFDSRNDLKRVIFMNWISGFIYEDRILSVYLSKMFIKLFVCQKDNFTMFNPLMPLTFKSVYTQRFFELCHKYETYKSTVGHNPIIKISDLITMFGLESNKSYKKNIYDFERRVIVTAQEELFNAVDEKRSDISFKYNRIKGPDGYCIELIVVPSDISKNIHKGCIRMSKKIMEICNKYIKNQNSRIEAFGDFVSSMPSISKAESILKKINDTITRYEGKTNPEIGKVLSYVIKEEYGI